MTSRRECWCGKVHADPPADFAEAVTAFGHLLIAEARVPQLAAWLNRRLSR